MQLNQMQTLQIAPRTLRAKLGLLHQGKMLLQLIPIDESRVAL
jgi:hypothetical protein